MNKKTRVELLWIVGVLVVIAAAMYWNFMVVENQSSEIAQADNGKIPTGPNVIDVVATQWLWSFTNSTGNTTYDAFTVNVSQTYTLVITSAPTPTSSAVIHSLLIPQLGLQSYAVPGQTNIIHFTPTHTGSYYFVCAEYCGEGHYTMRGYMTVVP
jgi:cytochrome c oxidase subunit 2